MRGERITGSQSGAQTGEDDRGHPVFAREQISFMSVAPCEPLGSSEGDTSFGPDVITGYRVFGPAGLVLRPDAVFTIRGVSGYQLDGDVGEWRSGAGRRRQTVFIVRRSSS